MCTCIPHTYKTTFRRHWSAYFPFHTVCPGKQSFFLFCGTEDGTQGMPDKFSMTKQHTPALESRFWVKTSVRDIYWRILLEPKPVYEKQRKQKIGQREKLICHGHWKTIRWHLRCSDIGMDPYSGPKMVWGARPSFSQLISHWTQAIPERRQTLGEIVFLHRENQQREDSSSNLGAAGGQVPPSWRESRWYIETLLHH